LFFTFSSVSVQKKNRIAPCSEHKHRCLHFRSEKYTPSGTKRMSGVQYIVHFAKKSSIQYKHFIHIPRTEIPSSDLHHLRPSLRPPLPGSSPTIRNCSDSRRMAPSGISLLACSLQRPPAGVALLRTCGAPSYGRAAAPLADGGRGHADGRRGHADGEIALAQESKSRCSTSRSVLLAMFPSPTSSSASAKSEDP
jgi:hypothetical protein